MLGEGERGILINESTDALFSGEAPGLRLFVTYDDDFYSPLSIELLADSLYNDEANWENGAFNRLAEGGDEDDYGWGTYNSSTGAIEGAGVFVLKFKR